MRFTADSRFREEQCLDTLVPHDPNVSYDIRDVSHSLFEAHARITHLSRAILQVINYIVDDYNFFEIQPKYAKNIVIGFGRMEGRTAAFVANQPVYSTVTHKRFRCCHC